MTIRKGQDWGRQAPLPDDGVIVNSDSEARLVVTEARRSRSAVPTIGLLGGDLAKALGATGDRSRLTSNQATEVPIDLGTVLVDGAMYYFVAHLVVRRPLWAGRFFLAMNTEYLGPWKVAPRAHPNDGRLDVLDGSLSLDDRVKARGRLRSGDHLPHPGIATQQTSHLQVEFERPTEIRLDGDSIGRAKVLSIRVEPDALRCVY